MSDFLQVDENSTLHVYIDNQCDELRKFHQNLNSLECHSFSFNGVNIYIHLIHYDSLQNIRKFLVYMERESISVYIKYLKRERPFKIIVALSKRVGFFRAVVEPFVHLNLSDRHFFIAIVVVIYRFHILDSFLEPIWSFPTKLKTRHYLMKGV